MSGFLNLIFGRNKSITQEIDPMKKFLIVGLGNIGAEYADTRHNIGFKVLDYFAEKESLKFETKRLGDLTSFKFKGRTFVFLKPNTYMNLSGKAVRYWMNTEKIPIENILVITDDINLDFGTIRVKGKGSDGGHNGLKNIQQELNTNKYPRFRFGIGDSFSKGKQVDYVLGEWSDDELSKMPERLEKSYELIKSFGTAGMNNTMNTFNGK
ncbi:peptidyl-tRNA hydrolase, PTH1 family [Zhouia amylolytica]|uniref:Peptidyl-tRNA hydrolase n=2 Tax=Zhouia amylolytica TaxID=376730 RepID=W2ULH6_9FLAO|nr:peptidyl-tRNA hydrolase [Zhouia amylolytica AD3]MCQ0111434.1 aminoacyl-tRNA hydrolase [Zhouia amylolytica]SFS38391.1 peptidyl-tRNA hydrolase, PTH1 family [Zhouia amylolytica]